MNILLTKCEQSVNMKNGDGLADVVSAVCLVAGHEEHRQIRPDVWLAVCLLFCMVCASFFFVCIA